MYDLITIGDCLIDTFLLLKNNQANITLKKSHKKLSFDYGEKININESHVGIGGNACNVVIGAKKLGLKTSIITEIGDDINGKVIKKQLKGHSIDTKFVHTNKGQETAYAIVLNYHAERTILSKHPQRDYQLPKMPKVKWIYYTSMGKGFPQLQKELIDYLKENPDVKLAINPGSYQFAKGLRTIKRILRLSDVIICNKEEARKIVGNTISIKSLLKQLNAVHGGTTVITDGTRGAYATDGQQMWKMPIYPFTPIARTGAGDAYSSGFLAAIIKGKGILTAMQWGAANAGKVVQCFGAQNGLSDEKEINKTIKTYREYEPVLL